MMKIIITFLVLLLGSINAYGTESTDIVGKRLCEINFDNPSEYSVGLDRKNGLHLVLRKKENIPVMMIVRYDNAEDSCGTVQDVVVASSSKNYFEFYCSDSKHPSEIVVGEISNSRDKKSYIARHAWIVNLGSIKFEPSKSKTVCYKMSYSGPDDNEDLVIWKNKRLH